jgi:hypothetical protein
MGNSPDHDTLTNPHIPEHWLLALWDALPAAAPRMDEQGLRQRDLVPYIGARSESGRAA